MLDSKQCEAFLAVAEVGSFDAAGEHLCITPSAVSLRTSPRKIFRADFNNTWPSMCAYTSRANFTPAFTSYKVNGAKSLQGLMGKSSESEFYKIALASNADSLATWLLPSIQQTLLKKNSIRAKIDDQSHTHTLLETGQVNACITAEEQVMAGCLAQPLGKMRYKMLASAEFVNRWFSGGVNREVLRKHRRLFLTIKI